MHTIIAPVAPWLYIHAGSVKPSIKPCHQNACNGVRGHGENVYTVDDWPLVLIIVLMFVNGNHREIKNKDIGSQSWKLLVIVTSQRKGKYLNFKKCNGISDDHRMSFWCKWVKSLILICLFDNVFVLEHIFCSTV